MKKLNLQCKECKSTNCTVEEDAWCNMISYVLYHEIKCQDCGHKMYFSAEYYDKLLAEAK